MQTSEVLAYGVILFVVDFVDRISEELTVDEIAAVCDYKVVICLNIKSLRHCAGI